MTSSYTTGGPEDLVRFPSDPCSALEIRNFRPLALRGVTTKFCCDDLGPAVCRVDFGPVTC